MFRLETLIEFIFDIVVSFMLFIMTILVETFGLDRRAMFLEG